MKYTLKKCAYCGGPRLTANTENDELCYECFVRDIGLGDHSPAVVEGEERAASSIAQLLHYLADANGQATYASVSETLKMVATMISEDGNWRKFKPLGPDEPKDVEVEVDG